MAYDSNKRSPLIEAFEKLQTISAIGICNSTPVPKTGSHIVVDQHLASFIAQTKDAFAFVPEENIYRTYAVLRSANDAWQHDKLPVLAVCAFSKSPHPFQRETGIQTETADQFLADLKFAHRIQPKLGAKPAYIIRHYHAPNDKHDEVILPARANLIVYQPHAIAPKELATLFEHVASVQGKVILCDNREALAISYPELSDAVARSLSRAIPHELSKALSPSPSTEKHEERDVREHTLTLPDRPTPKDKPYVPSTDALSQFDLPREGRSYLLYHTATDKPSDFPDGYRLVAKIRADNIYRALADSQHFGSPWPENENVVTLRETHRSTQPGDVIVHKGVAYRLGPADFGPLNPQVRPSLEPSITPTPANDVPEHETPEPAKPRHKIKP